MLTILHIIWHGPTLFSQQGRCEGWSDSPLSDDALAAAKACGQALRAKGCARPDVFVTSISERACDMLELVSTHAWGDVPTYQRLKGLKDLNYGSYEAQSMYLAPAQPYESFFVKFGGESDEQLAVRLQSTLADVAKAHPGASVLVSTHRYALERFCTLWSDDAARVVAQSAPGTVLDLSFDTETGVFSLVDAYPSEV